MHGKEKIYTLKNTSNLLPLMNVGDTIKRSKLCSLARRHGLIYEKIDNSNKDTSVIYIKDYKMEVLIEATYNK